MSETQRYAMIAMGEGHSGHHGAPAPIVDRPNFHGHRDLVVRVVSLVDEVVVADWDGLARAQAQAVFFDRRFLRGVEAGVEPGLECHYALFYEGERPVGLGYFQIADFVGQPVGPLLERAPATVAFAARSLKLLEKVFRVRLIVCGNAFTSGQHGFVFLPEVSPDRAVRGLLDAVEHIRQGQTEPAGTSKPAATAVLFKDFDHDAAMHRIAGRLRDHGFSDLETQPNMVLDIDPSWDGYEDYLQSLASKYRVKANRAFAKSRDLVSRAPAQTGEVLRMKVPYVEGLASRNDPESCADTRKGLGEALTGGGTGEVLSREKLIKFGAPTPWDEAEGNTTGSDTASYLAGSARSETLCMYPSTSYGSREIPCPTRGAPWSVPETSRR